jgi:hypothetical protein
MMWVRIQVVITVATLPAVGRAVSAVSFREPIPIDGRMPNSYRFVQTDLNGDHLTDIVVTQGVEAQFFWFERKPTVQPEYVRHDVQTPHPYGGYISIGDLDHDGDQDIVSTGLQDPDTQYLLWRANDGGINPSFTTRVIDDDFAGGHRNLVVDWDGDDDLDVAACTDYLDAKRPASIRLYLNDGASPPRFSKRICRIPGQGTTVQDFEVADFDGDGRLDIIVADSLTGYEDQPGEILWLRNLGGSSPLEISRLYECPTIVFDVAVADLDWDGDCDVAAACHRDVLWLENHHSRGDPTLTVHAIKKELGTPRSIVIADVDLDEDLDLLVIYSETDRIVLHESDGHSPLAFTARLFAQPYRPVLLQTDDLDKDGDLDVLSLNRGTVNLSWYENRRIVAEDVIEIGPPSGFESSGREGGPFDRESFRYTISNHSSAKPLDWQVTTDANWLSIEPSQGTLGPDSSVPVMVAFNEKATSLHSGNCTAQIGFRQVGQDRPVTIKQIALHIISRYFNNIVEPWDIAQTPSYYTYFFGIADLNGDGAKDILSKDYWLEQRLPPAHGFTRHAESLPLGCDGKFSVGDLDGDGDLDALTYTPGDTPSLVWRDNDGFNPPRFTSRSVVSPSSWVMDSLIVDLDGDGDNDIVVAFLRAPHEEGPSIYWFENDGGSPPGFRQRLVDATIRTTYTCQLLSSDFDGDGDIDLLVQSDDPRQVTWLENLSSRPLTFNPHVLPSQEGCYPTGMAIADFNGDGRADPVVCYTSQFEFGAGKVIQFENHLTDSSSHWRPVLMDESIISPDLVDVGDLDSDGDLDAFVLAWAYDEDRIYYIEQLGRSTNTFATVLFQEMYRPRYIRMDDIDQDGDKDILLQGLSDLRLYENIAIDAIRLISPKGGEQFKEQAAVSVSWKTDVMKAGTEIRIELWRRGRFVRLLGYGSDPSGRGAEMVSLPLVRFSDGHTIRIVSMKDPGLYDESAPFMIGSPPPSVPRGEK